jgi:hypothetical protein
MDEHEHPRSGTGQAAPRDGSPPHDEPHDGSLDFFGASAAPTLPVPSAPAPETGQAPTAPARVRRGVRIRTVVFGLVLLVISGASLVALLTSIRVDAGVVFLGLMIGAGAALLIGGVSAAVRDARQGGTRLT